MRLLEILRRPGGIHLARQIAVVIVAVGGARRGGQLVRRIICVRRNSQRAEPVAHRVVAVALRRVHALRGLRQLVNRVIAVAFRSRAPLDRAQQLLFGRQPLA